MSQKQPFYYYFPINYTTLELHVFLPSDTEHLIKLTFSESVSLALKTRLMTLLTMPQETSSVSALLHGR